MISAIGWCVFVFGIITIGLNCFLLHRVDLFSKTTLVTKPVYWIVLGFTIAMTGALILVMTAFGRLLSLFW